MIIYYNKMLVCVLITFITPLGERDRRHFCAQQTAVIHLGKLTAAFALLYVLSFIPTILLHGRSFHMAAITLHYNVLGELPRGLHSFID